MTAVALAKARAVARALAEEAPSEPRPSERGPRSAQSPLPAAGAGRIVVLGADTEVVLDGRLLGKPRNPAEATRMLAELRGRTHDVITGVALVEARGAHAREETAHVVTRVRMREYSDQDIDAYVATGEPLDKAGAYAVQGVGSRLVAQVDGCLTNVVGLPLTTTRAMLSRWGVL